MLLQQRAYLAKQSRRHQTHVQYDYKVRDNGLIVQMKYECRTDSKLSPPTNTANGKHPYTTHTLANRQNVKEDYERFGECKGGVQEILRIV